MVQISHFLDHPYTLRKGTHIANFSILTPEQTKHIQPVNPTSVRHLLNNSHDDAIYYINSLLNTSKNDEFNETYWFPTPQNPCNEKEHTPIQTRILNELRELEQLEKLNPSENTNSRNQFLSNFDWTDSTLQPEPKQAVENLLVEFHDIFARHRFDIGINTEFKVQLTPVDNRPAYSQSLPAPINLMDEILVEPALLHKYGIITTLPFSKYASPIIAQRKPNWKLRLLVDLRKINTLIADDYINNNHPVSTLTDAAQHMAGKNLFCKLDCSQAYHCLQMADQQTIELLAFNFASRTFTYRRLAQGLNRSLSAFSSFIPRSSHQSRPMRTICRLYWHSRQYPGTIDQKSTSSFPVSTESLSQTQHGQMPFWCTRSGFPWKNINNQRGCPSKTKHCQIPRKCQNSTIQNSTSTIFCLSEILTKLHTQTGRTTHTALPTTQNN